MALSSWEPLQDVNDFTCPGKAAQPSPHHPPAHTWARPLPHQLGAPSSCLLLLLLPVSCCASWLGMPARLHLCALERRDCALLKDPLLLLFHSTVINTRFDPICSILQLVSCNCLPLETVLSEQVRQIINKCCTTLCILSKFETFLIRCFHWRTSFCWIIATSVLYPSLLFSFPLGKAAILHENISRQNP